MVKKIGESTGRLIVLIVVYVIVAAIINNFVFPLISTISFSASSVQFSGKGVYQYAPYVNILLALLFGYFILQAFVNVVYWNLRLKYDHPTAASMRSVFRIIGVGALVAAIAGAVGGAASGVALGGFLGIVIGFASQQVIGQALAGLFVLLSRPFTIKDHVGVQGEDGTVEEITTLFTYIKKADNTMAILPNNMVMGSKVYLYPKQQTQGAQQGQK
ncbi:MAG: mechanosensitive ion channel domain-containing protein [Candidatus Aramenus sulfurataquae]|uniref:Mechanosensitive ion channel domain-containing protein n=1 Tax=Candidatus Aramenus sulfurataquae TaxID=1326980 RepID=A0ACC6TRS4_9CREN